MGNGIGLKKNLRMQITKRPALYEKIMLRRCCKTIAHEIGHMHQIGHCVYYDCMMNGSGHLQEDFQQSMHLCPVDLKKLDFIIGNGNILKRYENLLSFYEQQGWNGDADWITNRISNDENQENTIIDLTL